MGDHELARRLYMLAMAFFHRLQLPTTSIIIGDYDSGSTAVIIITKLRKHHDVPVGFCLFVPILPFEFDPASLGCFEAALSAWVCILMTARESTASNSGTPSPIQTPGTCLLLTAVL